LWWTKWHWGKFISEYFILPRAVHLVRMSDDETVKQIFLGKPDGKRNAGRPK
jgi:hypothetical protein